MKSLIGEYYCKLDSKGRFSLPAGLRKQLPTDQQNNFVINRGLDQCLVLFPEDVWHAELAKIRSQNQYVAKNRAFTRMFLNGASPVTLDGNARVLVTKRLMQHAGISKEIVLLGQIDRIEIWAKQAYEDWCMNPGYDFERLAEEVMLSSDDTH